MDDPTTLEEALAEIESLRKDLQVIKSETRAQCALDAAKRELDTLKELKEYKRMYARRDAVADRACEQRDAATALLNRIMDMSFEENTSLSGVIDDIDTFFEEQRAKNDELGKTLKKIDQEYKER